MAFCKFCGGQLPEGAHNCPNCGAEVNGGAAPDSARTNAQQTNGFMGADASGEFDMNDLSSNQWCWALAYLWILFFLPLVVYPDSRVGRFHANQGLLLFIFTTACEFVAGLLGIFAGIPVIGALFSVLAGFIGWAAGIIHLAAFIYALVNILNNKAVELPLIGKYRLIK